MSAFYGVYHGASGLRAIAKRVRALTHLLREGLTELGFEVHSGPCFDTLRIGTGNRHQVVLDAADAVIGTLRTMGVSRRQLFGNVLRESMLIGVPGTVVGLVLGWLLGAGLTGLVVRTIDDLYFRLELETLQWIDRDNHRYGAPGGRSLRRG